SSAFDLVSHRRRRAAVERRPRLCASPHHAPRHASCASDRQPRSVDVSPGARARRRNGTAYPELVRAQALITETLKLEETRFRETLVRGLKLLDEATDSMSK